MRQQHYRFAHQLLMSAVLADTVGFWQKLTTEATLALLPIWNAAAEGLPDDQRVEPNGLGVVPIAKPPEYEAHVVIMPEPAAPTECHYAALIRRPGGPIRYFVMEKGVDNDDGSPRAYWAEWRAAAGSTMRIRGQDLPAVSQEAFLAAIAPELAVAGAGPDAVPVAAGPPLGAAGPPLGAAGPPPGAAFLPGPPMGGVGPLPPPPKKSKALLYGCGGCLTILVLLLAFGGYLLYLEEGRSFTEPGDEVTSIDIEDGRPFELKYTWDGTNYAHHDMWLVVQGQKDGGAFRVKGELGCSRGSSYEPRKRPISTSLSDYKVANRKSLGGDKFSAWIGVHDEYDRSSSRPFTCTGVLKAEQGSMSKARLVVTRKQRPSDWIAF